VMAADCKLPVALSIRFSPLGSSPPPKKGKMHTSGKRPVICRGISGSAPKAPFSLQLFNFNV